MNKHFNKFSANQKGFTIIELLVVIAIIAVLAAVVLVNVTGYINKGKDAAAKGNLSTMMTNAAFYYDDSAKGNGNFDGFLADAFFDGPSDAATTAGYTVTSQCDGTGADCGAGDATTKWCASIVLKANSANSFCVDSAGKKVEAATASATCAAGACP